MAAPFTIGGASPITYRGVYGTYQGYGYDETANVVKLLGRDPTQVFNNEVALTSAIGSKSTTLQVYAEGNTALNAFIALLFTQVTHNAGDGTGDHLVTVMAVKQRAFVWTGGTVAAPGEPTYVVTLTLREHL